MVLRHQYWPTKFPAYLSIKLDVYPHYQSQATSLSHKMSSIVKKSSHFAPKVKKRVTRNNKAAQPTPPTTQESHASPDPTQITQPDEASISTPPTTQATGGLTDLSKYEIAAPSEKTSDENTEDAEIVDPKDTSKVTNEEVIEDEGSDAHEDDDNDYFKKTLAEKEEIQKSQRRRSSVASRRLSGIFNRSGSVSTPGSVAPDGDDAQAAPVQIIGIPTAKPSKTKRTKLSTSRPSKRLKSSVAAPDQTLVEEDENTSTATRDDAKNGESRILGPDFVVGINPVTNRVEKYKAHAGIPGPLSVAPPDLITTVKDIRQLPRKIDAEDEALYAKLTVLADDLTVKELCKPTLKIGSVSGNFHDAEHARGKLEKDKKTRRKARIRAREQRISYEKALEEIQQEDNELSKKQSDKEKPKEPEQPTPSNLKMGISGDKITLDAESIVKSNNQAAEKGDRQVEVDNSYLNPITSNSYTKLAYTDAWTTDELVQFYNALSTWGTDFTFIAQLFPYRNRRQIKRKFTLEEKKRPELVELALKRQLPADLDAYCAAAADGKNFKSLKEVKDEIEKLRKDHETHLNEIQSERERAIKEDLEASRKREMEIRTGSRIMTRAERERELRKNEVVLGTVDDSKKPTRALKGEN